MRRTCGFIVIFLVILSLDQQHVIAAIFTWYAHVFLSSFRVRICTLPWCRGVANGEFLQAWL